MDGSDGRTYVALGKLFVQQRRYDEAREIYEEGSTATGRASRAGIHTIATVAYAIFKKEMHCGLSRIFWDFERLLRCAVMLGELQQAALKVPLAT